VKGGLSLKGMGAFYGEGDLWPTAQYKSFVYSKLKVCFLSGGFLELQESKIEP